MVPQQATTRPSRRLPNVTAGGWGGPWASESGALRSRPSMARQARSRCASNHRSDLESVMTDHCASTGGGSWPVFCLAPSAVGVKLDFILAAELDFGRKNENGPRGETGFGRVDLETFAIRPVVELRNQPDFFTRGRSGRADFAPGSCGPDVRMISPSPRRDATGPRAGGDFDLHCIHYPPRLRRPADRPIRCAPHSNAPPGRSVSVPTTRRHHRSPDAPRRPGASEKGTHGDTWIRLPGGQHHHDRRS